MKKVLILGGTGMLGSEVTKTLLKKGNYQLTSTYKNMNYVAQMKAVDSIYNEANWEKFDFPEFTSLKIEKFLSNYDFVFNAIGAIPQKTSGLTAEEAKRFYLVNSTLPQLLIDATRYTQIPILSIGTDCVFDGEKGGYTEKSVFSANSDYGISKSKGEPKSKNFLLIRCSIIGKELNSSFSLLSWFLNQPRNAILHGYTNHYWNGITAVTFGKIVNYMVNNYERFLNKSIHFIPRDIVSKYDLLLLFSHFFKRDDILVQRQKHADRIDRSLSTIYPSLNEIIWKNIGYSESPDIRDLIKEYSADHV